MYFVNKDLSIYATRGDAVVLAVGANNNGVPYVFQPGEVVRFRVFEKKGCHCTVLQKDFIITDAVESVDIVLTKNETEIGEIISKPKDYWYEIELNPNYNPQTIVGYDDDGPKVFRLFPEGADVAGGEGEAPDEYVPAIGGYLPYVTEEDNGKTVRVVDGEWALAEGGGGGGNITVDDVKPFRFTVTKNGKKCTSSATFEEIEAVLNEGNRLVICEFNKCELPFAGYFGLNMLFYTGALASDILIYISKHGVRVDIENPPVTIVNVLDYGAVGDGVTDDTEAIQEALYYAEELGLPLYFPTGTYLVSSTITTHTRDTDADKQTKNLPIYGDGFGSVIKTTEDFDGDYVFYLDVANAQPRSLWVHDFAIDLVADVSGIYFNEIGMKGIVENLWINHLYDKDPTDTNHRAGIECQMATVVTFSRIKIQGNRKRIGSGHENIGIVCHRSFSTSFTDCDIIFCKWGIYLNSGSDNTIENCRIDENEYGVYQNSTADTINYMPETRAYPVDGSNGIVHRGTFRNLTIRNNRFERNNQQAIFLAAYSVGEDTYMYNAQITIENNDFSGLGADIAFQTSAREVFRKAIHLYQCKGIVIGNNAFTGKAYDENNAESMLQVLAGSKVDDLTIRSNVAVSNPMDDGTIVKTSPKISADLLNYKFGKWQPKSLAEQGIVDDIEVDQSTRDRWRSEIGDINAALEELHAYAQSLVSGGAAE
jgi:parallel beta-helix repeat protein